MMELLTKSLASRFKVVAAVFLVGMVPVIVKSIEVGTGFDIPGGWESSASDWVVAILAGVGVNYAENVKV
jgi:hypothetical protein